MASPSSADLALANVDQHATRLPTIHWNKACYWKGNNRQRFFACFIAQIQWNPETQEIRMYLDARGEWDLRGPGASTVGFAKSGPLLSGQWVPEVSVLGHSKGYIRFTEKTYQTNFSERRDGEPLTFCYANRSHVWCDYQPIEFPTWEQISTSQDFTTEESPFAADTDESERARWSTVVSDCVLQRRLRIPGRSPNPGLTILWVETPSSDKASSCAIVQVHNNQMPRCSKNRPKVEESPTVRFGSWTNINMASPSSADLALANVDQHATRLPTIHWNKACYWKWNNRQRFFACFIAQIQWNPETQEIRMYLDARGEWDLRGPGASTVGFAKSGPLLSGQWVPEVSVLGHSKGYIRFTEKTYQTNFSERRDGEPLTFCYANRSHVWCDYQPIEFPTWEQISTSQDFTTEESPFAADTDESERARWSTLVPDYLLQRRPGIPGRSPNPGLTTWWVETPSSDQSSSCAIS